jgi:hypothetical protein
MLQRTSHRHAIQPRGQFLRIAQTIGMLHRREMNLLQNFIKGTNFYSTRTEDRR